MITKHKKNSYKFSLLGMAAVLLLGGCALTMPKSSEQPFAQPIVISKPGSEAILKLGEVESVQIVGSLVDRKPKTPLYTNESSSGKEVITNIVSRVNEATLAEGPTEFGKHGYPDVIKIERLGESTVIEPAVNCVVSKQENGTTTKSYSPVDGEVVLTKDSVKTLLASSELFEWLKNGAQHSDPATPVAPQYSDKTAPGFVKLTVAEYSRMADIIIAVNKGELPVSALKDAEPLLERDLQGITKKTWAEYNALKE
ncbi:hypothetical protein ACFPYJ_32350 [Paenibacillus solisilvae]|uniref:Uncharacterized protein n=1 Tax=Paenibacillus solisilvae TaxID=2486751 RepID=A0ABW0WBR0_9BACL